MRFAVAILLLSASPLAAQSAAPAPSDAEVKALGDRLTRWILAGRADSSLAHMSEPLRQRIGGAKGIEETASDIAGDVGKEIDVLMESVSHRNDGTDYWRMSKFSEMDDEPLVWHWVFDANGSVTGIGLNSLGSMPIPE